ncbi:MAG: hypothetical protein LKK09_05815 [Olsenella sp.]|jgi:hypothetical protein|nr:hypothetical protein [Olsenella sp.]MCI2123659.1 hypothetical protein [Olsenella sp.]
MAAPLLHHPRGPGSPTGGRPTEATAYYTIHAGQAVSQVGSSAVQFALVWFLAQETASPAAMGLAGLAAFQIVSMISTPIGLVVASPVAEVLGVSAWFAISGVAIVLLGAAMLVLEGRARRAVGGRTTRPA